MSDLTPFDTSELSTRISEVFDPPRQARFLDQLAQTGNVRAACAAAGISPQTAYRARRAKPAFARLWDAALIHARAAVEQVLADRALNGVDEPIYYRGEEIGHRRRYDSRLLLAHLARLDRLAERAEAAEEVGDFDAALAALERGEGDARKPAPPSGQEVPELEAAFRWLEENGIWDTAEQDRYLAHTNVMPGMPLEPLPDADSRESSPKRGGGPAKLVEGHAVAGASPPAFGTSPVPLHHPADGPPPRSGEEPDGMLPPDPHDFRRFAAPKSKRP